MLSDVEVSRHAAVQHSGHQRTIRTAGFGRYYAASQHALKSGQIPSVAGRRDHDGAVELAQAGADLPNLVPGPPLR